jgi:hypothetical protein
MRKCIWLAMAILFVGVALAEDHVSRKAPTMVPNIQPKHVLDTGDLRIEAVARAICKAKGIDPDHVGPPFPEGPLWEFFIVDAALFLKEYDAAVQATPQKAR